MSKNVESLVAAVSLNAASFLGLRMFGFRKKSVLNEEHKPYLSEKSIQRLAYFADHLYRYMEDEKPYLDENFRVETALVHLCTNRTTMTRVVSYYFGCTFPRFVNKFRVHHAIMLMQQDPKMRISHAARLSGFKSETVFRTAFNLEVGMSPSELRYRQDYWEERTSRIMDTLWVRELPKDFRR